MPSLGSIVDWPTSEDRAVMITLGMVWTESTLFVVDLLAAGVGGSTGGGDCCALAANAREQGSSAKGRRLLADTILNAALQMFIPESMVMRTHLGIVFPL